MSKRSAKMLLCFFLNFKNTPLEYTLIKVQRIFFWLVVMIVLRKRHHKKRHHKKRHRYSKIVKNAIVKLFYDGVF